MTSFLYACVALFMVASEPVSAQDSVSDPMKMPIARLEQIAPDEHPSMFFILALRNFEEGRKREALRWLYVGQIRWRFHIAVHPNLEPDGDSALLASMMEDVGRPINEWAAGDIEGWIAGMQAALDWDSSNANGFTAKSEHPFELEVVRGGLEDLIASIEQQRDDIAAERSRNGLENQIP